MKQNGNMHKVVLYKAPSEELELYLNNQFSHIHFVSVNLVSALPQNIDLLILFDNAQDIKKHDTIIWATTESYVPELTDELLPQCPEKEFIAKRVAHFFQYKMQSPLLNRALMQLANSVNNSVAICDAKGNMLWVNKAFEKIYGYSKDEFINHYGKNIEDFSDQDGIRNKLQTINTQQYAIDYVSEITTRNGEIKYLQTTLSPIFEKSELKWIVAIEADITELKNTGKLLEDQSGSLQKLTSELQEANQEMEAQRDRMNEQHKELTKEKERTDELLHNILPEVVAHQLKKGKKKPKRHKSVTVMFADFKGFTKICQNLDPPEIVHTLDELFTRFDAIIEKHFIEKIKTIGDAYMCAGGMPMKNNSHPINIVMAALEIQQFLLEYNKPRMLNQETVWECRIGVHSGEVFAGVVGERKFAYDIWGDTVNLASRMETSGAVNSVNVSETTYEFVKDYFECVPRGEIEVKNIGSVNMYFVTGLKKEYASDATGVFPNEEFKKILNRL